MVREPRLYALCLLLSPHLFTPRINSSRSLPPVPPRMSSSAYPLILAPPLPPFFCVRLSTNAS